MSIQARALPTPVDVAFITVNYNTRPLVETLVEFFRSTALPFTHSLTVVDNGSTDGSLEYLARCRHASTVSNGENLGYGRAMNRGIAATESKYLCLLNTDVVLNAEALTALWRHLESHPETGLSSPRICYRGGRTQGFIFSDGLIPLYSMLADKLLAKYHKVRLAWAKRPLRVDGVFGAFLFLKRTICPDAKLFDEDYFFYFEDTDLARRLVKRGVRCDVLPDQRILHLGGQSTGAGAGVQFYRSKFLYARKQFGARHAATLLWLERFRLWNKVLFYRALDAVSSSEKIRPKLARYASVMRAFDTLTASLPTRESKGYV